MCVRERDGGFDRERERERRRGGGGEGFEQLESYQGMKSGSEVRED